MIIYQKSHCDMASQETAGITGGFLKKALWERAFPFSIAQGNGRFSSSLNIPGKNTTTAYTKKAHFSLHGEDFLTISLHFCSSPLP